MNKKQYENCMKWVRALRSGKYKQGRERLFEGKNYCCLGVAAKEVLKKKPLTAEQWEKRGHERQDFENCYSNDEEFFFLFKKEKETILFNSTIPDETFVTKFGLSATFRDYLAMVNDSEGYTFEEIAKVIDVTASISYGETDLCR